MKQNIVNKIQNSKSNNIQVISAFNGFGIYKTQRFKGFYYDGHDANFKNIVTDMERTKTIEAFKKYNLNVNISTTHLECCEHLFYHLSAVKQGRVIKISKFIIN